MKGITFKDFLNRVHSIDEKRITPTGILKIRELNEEITQLLTTLIEPENPLLPILVHIINEQKIFENLEYAKVYLQDYFVSEVEHIKKVTNEELHHLVNHIIQGNRPGDYLYPLKAGYSQYYYNHHSAICALELLFNIWAIISYLHNNAQSHSLAIIAFNLGQWVEKQRAHKGAYDSEYAQKQILQWKRNDKRDAKRVKRLVLLLKFIQSKKLYLSLNDVASEINNKNLKTLNIYLSENNSEPFTESHNTQNTIYNWLKRQLNDNEDFDGQLTKINVNKLIKYFEEDLA